VYVASTVSPPGSLRSSTRCFVKAIVTGNIPFTFVDNPHLIEACQSVGLPTISRRQLADKWVPLLAEEASISNAATLARMALVDASSDGCRNKYREKGAALNNIIAFVPYRAYFHDAINCTSMRKDAEAIATFLASRRRQRPRRRGSGPAGWLGARQHKGQLPRDAYASRAFP
jgi:hypothetical protein